MLTSEVRTLIRITRIEVVDQGGVHDDRADNGGNADDDHDGGTALSLSDDGVYNDGRQEAEAESSDMRKVVNAGKEPEGNTECQLEDEHEEL